MNKRKVLYADSSFEDLRDFENALATVRATVVHGNCKTPEDLIASGSDAVCIVTELISLDETVFQACPALELVFTNNVGTDLIDIPAATRCGIRVCNNPDYNFREVAEHTLALLLSLIRKIPKYWTNHQTKEETMKTIQDLSHLVSTGKTTRREFIARVSALGAAAALSPVLFSQPACASFPKKGGHFKLGMAGGATTDSLEPGTLLDHVPMVVQWQIKNNLVEIDREGNAIPELAESWEPSSDAAKWT